MTLIEAIESGKSFTCPRWEDWEPAQKIGDRGRGYYGLADMSANDFIIKDEKPAEAK